MANWYYLVSQLPAVQDVNAGRLPITEEYFTELCSRFFDKQNLIILQNLTLEPPLNPSATGIQFLDNWYAWERSLRLALARIRALRMKKEYTLPESDTDPEIMQTARTAAGFDNPLEAEQFLNTARAEAINRFSSMDNFSTDAVFAYALKLKLASRISKFNEEAGTASYHKIYDQILGDNK